jgi:hypothetical protein
MENKVVVPRRAAEGQPFWAERIAAWKASGKSQAAFCGEQGLSRWTMRRWIVRLGRKGAPAQLRPKLLSVPLHVEHRQASASAAEVEILLPNGARARIWGSGASRLIEVLAGALAC